MKAHDPNRRQPSKIERHYGVDGYREVPVACMVMEMVPQTDVTRMF